MNTIYYLFLPIIKPDGYHKLYSLQTKVFHNLLLNLINKRDKLNTNQ